MATCQKAAILFAMIAMIAWMTLTGCSKPTEPASSPDLLSAARKALRDSDLQTVEELVEQIPDSADEWQAGQLLAGEAAFKDGRPASAIAYYLDAAERDVTSPDGQLALFSAAEVHLEQGQLSVAESLYLRVLELQPDNGLTNERMAFLLSLTGRRWESLRYYFALIKGGDANYRELALAADIGRGIDQQVFLEKCKRLSPNDKLVRLALAAEAFEAGRPDAKPLLESLVRTEPELIAAQAMLGELLVENSDDASFLAWHDSLPRKADASPDIWFVRGLWARKQMDRETAADCFWQTVVRAPFHRRAFYALGQMLAAVGDPDAERIANYSERLVKLSLSVDQVLHSEGRHEKAFRRTAELLEELGRVWEACAWGLEARRRFPQAEWPHLLLSRQSHKLNGELPWIEPETNPAAKRTFGDVPEFDRLIARVADRIDLPGRVTSGSAAMSASIRFEEADAISFSYHNGDDPETKGVRTFEQTGGGVAILDFDMDGAPDVFLPQGSDWKTGEHVPTPSPRFRDALFRNLSDGTFGQVPESAFGEDSGYGQGCAAGDFNNDGFPDLYVANVGRNALYENMGDGTFSQVTESAGLVDASWTVSAMICDLNADGLPDIVDVNYLTGRDVYTKICKGKACSPTAFEGAPDRLLINRGDGRFTELPGALPRSDSKGMGIVAFELEPNRRPMLFIANDQVANYFLSNRPADNSANIRLSDEAVVNGLAFNDEGLPMACMGIAADDWNGDNRLDLYVTNFHNEANTLYLQDFTGLFVDRTKDFGLYDASMPMVGWGAQSLDADLDGLPDLVLVNGHVDDYRDRGGEYHMRPQFFQNVGGRFQELTADDVGSWFGRKYLGRGLARVDWNLDGLPDFIVSNMNAPASVLENKTTNAGRFFRVRLHATRTARDAIGARVTLRFAGRDVTRQLLAGDGYMASNERVLEFGLREVEQVDEAVIRWPSGAVSRLKSPPLDATWIVVEGLDLATGRDASGQGSFPVAVETKAEP